MDNLLSIDVTSRFIYRQEQCHLWTSFVVCECSSVKHQKLLKLSLFCWRIDWVEAIHAKVQSQSTFDSWIIAT